MKKSISVILAILMLIAIVPINAIPIWAAEGEFAGGSGTEEDPYLIENKYQLNNVRNHLSSSFKLINDIEFSHADFAEGGEFYNDGQGWEPIGDPWNRFGGKFDGDCYKISNLCINNPRYYAGLFSSVSTFATIENVILAECNIISDNYAGGITGELSTGNGPVNISNCYVSGTISGRYAVGGICGRCNFYTNTGIDNSIKIEQCFNTATISGEMAGGILGYIDISGWGETPELSKCCNTGTVVGSEYAGGILGHSYGVHEIGTSWYNGCEVTNSYNSGTVVNSDSTKLGGIIGAVDIGRIAAMYSYSVDMPLIGKVGASASYSMNGSKEISSDDEKHNDKSYYSSFDFDTVWTMDGDESYPYPELLCFRLQDTPVISGDCSYLSYAFADVSGFRQPDAEYQYRWYIDECVVSDSVGYTFTASDIGKEVKLEITSMNPLYKGSVSAKAVVRKAPQTEIFTFLPELLFFDSNKFEISTVATQEYSLDNENWQDSGVFSGLESNKEYTVYSRIKENDLYYAGESAPVLTVTTARTPISGTVSIIGEPRYGNVLTADLTGVLEDCNTFEYEWRISGQAVSTEYSYEIKKEDIGKSIILIVSGVGDYDGKLASNPPLSIKKALSPLMNAPILESVTGNSVSLAFVEGAEYSLDGIIWQKSPVFEDLLPATEYTFCQRFAETETHFPGETSELRRVTTLKKTTLTPDAPIVENVTADAVVLEKNDGYEYSMDGVFWQASNIFEGLYPDTEYVFYQRIAETSESYASDVSEVTVIKTTNVLPGDINNNGFINAVDSNLLKQVIVGLINAEPGSVICVAADIDKNGIINAVDSLILKKIIIGDYVVTG
ncbi:MAG: dockerin type I repeat-containing protein [Clostridia bacterium]|nr:dockerin type I repeat-containing protein [Clostridia bacterium]